MDYQTLRAMDPDARAKLRRHRVRIALVWMVAMLTCAAVSQIGRLVHSYPMSVGGLALQVGTAVGMLVAGRRAGVVRDN